jgi:hypothetical protein
VRYLVERTPCSRAAIRQEAIHVNAWKDFTANLAKSNGDVLGCWGVLATRAKAKAKSDTQRAVTPDAFPIFAASDVAGAPAGGELIVDRILDTTTASRRVGKEGAHLTAAILMGGDAMRGRSRAIASGSHWNSPSEERSDCGNAHTRICQRVKEDD